MMHLIREFLFLCVISLAFAQFQTTSTIGQRCTYTFLTESAICGNSISMRDVSQEFRPSWKHVKVIAYAGTFSLAGIEFRK